MKTIILKSEFRTPHFLFGSEEMSVASVRNNFCRILKCQGKFTADCESETFEASRVSKNKLFIYGISNSFNQRFFSVNSPRVDIKSEIVITC